MSTDGTGRCLVCYAETKNRCSRCGEAGIDLFFCSPEHQKLVWPGHRFFCGPNAFPLCFPFLSDEELELIIKNLHTRYLKVGGQTSTLYESLNEEGRLSIQDVKSMLRNELHRPQVDGARCVDEQYYLVSLRIPCESDSLSTSTRLLNRFASTAQYLTRAEAVPEDLTSCSPAEAELLHRTFAFVSLVLQARDLLEGQAYLDGISVSSATVTCYKGLFTYTIDRFPPHRAASISAAFRQRYPEMEFFSSAPA
ncbi:hypothetical protein NBRC10512_005743 [Rhodotorula toruloides]|uniref:RHTO0S21e00650g1_1 n=2 Tax=Rhodotorula toruloides TaxID=5286 RepID=A0A061BFV3_RHOTO|nr:zinc finger, MYND-type domain containing protein [Rhodotorula toruloides NP11]EMS18694.1 zinc finger, MYND-type domain containing protein [Rhodotorula toruloides NP11]CDR48871.1 RHTO0S21e00650g1_1 [Rhodotorula toruloides]